MIMLTFKTHCRVEMTEFPPGVLFFFYDAERRPVSATFFKDVLKTCDEIALFFMPTKLRLHSPSLRLIMLILLAVYIFTIR